MLDDLLWEKEHCSAGSGKGKVSSGERNELYDHSFGKQLGEFYPKKHIEKKTNTFFILPGLF
jgi:hypothetical protein